MAQPVALANAALPQPNPPQTPSESTTFRRCNHARCAGKRGVDDRKTRLAKGGAPGPPRHP